MRLAVFSVLLLSVSFSLKAQRKITIVGSVKGQGGDPIEGVTAITGYNSISARTDVDGKFIFRQVKQNSRYCISIGKEGYLPRTITFYHDTIRSPDTLFVVMTIRERKSLLIDTAVFRKDALKMRLKKIVRKYGLDTAECRVIIEPHGILRGIRTELGDSTYLWLQVPRTCGLNIKDIWRVRVTGIGLAFTNRQVRMYGTDFLLWGIWNPYCKD